MAAHVDGEVVKAPGTLVVSAYQFIYVLFSIACDCCRYVTCPDITKTVTPDLKLGNLVFQTDPSVGGKFEEGILLYIDLGQGKYRLGGSALAQVYLNVKRY